MKIVALDIQNIMRLRAVHLKPVGNTVVIGGDNGEGKSSVLESIVMALGGKKVMPDMPVRRGQTAAVIVADIEDYIITVNINGDTGASNLEVKSKQGAKIASPQKFLESIIGRVSYDPIQFIELPEDKQMEKLKEILKLDFTQLDVRRANAYGKRTDVTKEITALKTRISLKPPTKDGVPEEEIDPVDLARRVAFASSIDESLDNLETRGRDASILVEENTEQIQRLERELANARGRAVSLIESRDALRAEYAAKKKESKELNLSALEKELHQINSTNAEIRNNKEVKDLEAQLAAKEEEKQELSKEIGNVDIEKEKMLTDAKFPIEGLSFSDTGVLFNKVPFKQASTADKIRTSMAIAIGLNSNVRVVIIRDGSLLDNRSMAIVEEMAKAHDMQVWIERVSHGDECTIIIEDGEILEDRTGQEPKEKVTTTPRTGRKPIAGPRAK